jgi:hypothetical protein
MIESDTDPYVVPQIIGKALKRELLSSHDEISGLLSKLAAEGVRGWEAECRPFKLLVYVFRKEV